MDMSSDTNEMQEHSVIAEVPQVGSEVANVVTVTTQ